MSLVPSNTERSKAGEREQGSKTGAVDIQAREVSCFQQDGVDSYVAEGKGSHKTEIRVAKHAYPGWRLSLIHLI